MKYIQVAVNIPQVSGIFDYHLPAELEGQVQVGCLVVVPFGRQLVQGVVLRFIEHPQTLETRPVEALLDSQPVLSAAQMKLANQLAEQTLAPLALCLERMLPPGISQQADTLYQLNPYPPASNAELTPFQRRMIDLIQRRGGGLRGRQLEAAFPHVEWKNAAQALVRRGWLLSRPVLPPPTVRPKVVRTVQLTCRPEQVQAQWDKLGRGVALSRRQAILSFLQKEPWPVQVSWVYAASGGTLQDLYKLAELGLVSLGESEVWRDPLVKMEFVAYEAPPLTVEQQAAWEQICPALRRAASGEEQKPFLLYGVTGSGKTELYLRAVAETLQLGREAIVLVPEIALTPQTLRRFAGRFPGQVGLIHSRLSTGERYDTWRRARAGQLSVIVGPRSALFTPLPDPGLIVIDECHDDSFYQSESPPFYHSVQAARLYAQLTHSVLILGSATPEINLMYQAQQEGWNVLHLPTRILAHRQSIQQQISQLGLSDVRVLNPEGDSLSTTLPLPPVRIVDMRQELKEGNRSVFSRALQQALAETLKARQQAILFLNRRGGATYVFCRDCGYSLHCPRCDMPLTYHYGQEALLCHTCSYKRLMPKKCPQCGSPHIRQYGAGTEKVEAEVQALFPEARTLRWDAETTRQKGAHDILLSHFIHHRADILVGTQMLAKGLDLPLVTLVGVVLAEIGLNFPDFRAAERTFQLLTQVAGRAGRSVLGGQVILQTFQPEQAAIQFAARHDFEGFFQYELEQRRRLGYPPFYRLARLEYRHPNSLQAEDAAKNLARQLLGWIEAGQFTETEVIGPAPCFFGRIGGNYRWQILLRGPDPARVLCDLQGRLRDPLKAWKVEMDPQSVL